MKDLPLSARFEAIRILIEIALEVRALSAASTGRLETAFAMRRYIASLDAILDALTLLEAGAVLSDVSRRLWSASGGGRDD